MSNDDFGMNPPPHPHYQQQPQQQPPAPQYPEPVASHDPLLRITPWITPIAVALACIYLIYQYMLAVGPMIEVRFKDRVNLQENQTQVKYLGVEIGRVKDVYIDEDLENVVVKIRLEEFAEDFAKNGAQFWLIRPQLSLDGVEGLETLTGGSYIEGMPGEGEKQNIFDALPENPKNEAKPEDLILNLTAYRITKLRVGSPIMYRGIIVGQVRAITLNEDSDRVNVEIYIREKYKNWVNSSSQFWYTSGIEASFDFAEGVQLDFAGLPAILNGAISFQTLKLDAPAMAENTVIPLRNRNDVDNREKREKAIRDGDMPLTFITDAATKLSEGSAVLYRGMPVGYVTAVKLDGKDDRIEVSAFVRREYAGLVNESSRFWYASGLDIEFGIFSGANIEIGGLPTIMNGAISFVTLNPDAPRLDRGRPLHLNPKAKPEWKGLPAGVAANP